METSQLAAGPDLLRGAGRHRQPEILTTSMESDSDGEAGSVSKSRSPRPPSRFDIWLAGLTENSHRGLPAMIAGASNDEAKRFFWPVMLLAGIAFGIGEGVLGSFTYGLVTVLVVCVVVGVAWRVARSRRN